MSASHHPPYETPVEMTVKEFLEWCPEDGQRWELVDGTPQAMAPAKLGHGALQAELGALLRNHFAERGRECRALANPGVVPLVRRAFNIRVPDLAVTCGPFEANDQHVSDPVLIVEILSPSNQSETWANVWTYTTIPSVREILILRVVTMRADLLRRRDDGSWPESPMAVTEGELDLASIGFRVPLEAIYRGAGLNPERVG
jgi:Uma2 family endonuclease